MTVTEEDLRICEEAASPYVKRVLESGLTVRKCDETTTQLNFLELSSTTALKEGVADDGSIESWFAEVRVSQPYPDLENPASSNLLFRAGDQAHLQRYDSCKPVHTGGISNVNEPDTPPRMRLPTSHSPAQHGLPYPPTSI